MSGYDLKQFADESVRHFWAESFGQIYPILRRLEADGLVARSPGEAEQKGVAPTGRERIVYAISDAGRDRLARWLSEPARHEVGRVEVLLKLFFARNAPPEAAERLLREYRAEHVARLQGYDVEERRLRSERGGFVELPHWLATLDYGRHVSRALVAWCDETLVSLAAPSTPAKP